MTKEQLSLKLRELKERKEKEQAARDWHWLQKKLEEDKRNSHLS